MLPERRFPASRLAGVGDEAAVGLGGQLAALRALNWSAVELRTVDGTAMADLTPKAADAVAARLREAGVRVVCLASRIGNWARPITGSFDDDLAELETLAEQCALLGCGYVRIMSYPNASLAEPDWERCAIDRVRRLAARAERYGITLLHENCAGWAGSSGPRMTRMLQSVASPALRLLFDTGNGVPHGYDAYAMLDHVLPHVAHVHVKDAVATPTGTRYTLPGDGQARVADCLHLLLASGYTGLFSLEPHLAALPHEGRRPQGEDAAAPFVRAGERLHRMLDELTRSAQRGVRTDLVVPAAGAPWGPPADTAGGAGTAGGGAGT
jgi:sugar phosphate isomerase/epimerase